ncbi:SDR family NAD(P)-dependent oxidoreductase [Georgenia ruanii]|uniref:SDR family NAD(P)-dependent oxidoreductase n=1 Tax=Georgenia ruanii TaxID=348442 RepID=A0A7J9V0S2_9MICO|nr:SDR family NAD(P)-dependent oxidoreductase [Georgenia ruanii]MPV90485.1 SDR family NAD(P)-dependent oxidoreductase [Georgenia ruanii]
MTKRLQGKVAVVTGGASGIGEGIVRRLVAEGAVCVIGDIDDAGGERIVGDLGRSVRFVRADVTNEADVEALIDEAVTAHGRLDAMVNNAGVDGVGGSIMDVELDAWESTLAVLLRSVFLGTKHAARVMMRQGGGALTPELGHGVGLRGGRERSSVV